jgi:hypothetical protein
MVLARAIGVVKRAEAGMPAFPDRLSAATLEELTFCQFGNSAST